MDVRKFCSFFLCHCTIFGNNVAFVRLLLFYIALVSLSPRKSCRWNGFFLSLWCAHSFCSLSNEIIFHSIHFFVPLFCLWTCCFLCLLADFFFSSVAAVWKILVFFRNPTHTSNCQKGKLLCSETIFKWSAQHQPFFCYCFLFFISLSPLSSVPFFLVRNVSVTQQHLLPFRWVFFVFQFAWWWFQLCQSICPQRKTYTHCLVPQEIKKFVPLFFPLKGK